MMSLSGASMIQARLHQIIRFNYRPGILRAWVERLFRHYHRCPRSW
ncbi:hypothetical protein FOIG_16758 [Fusarium odoratissimum NRRL 54006]|uniref:Uncharacterized protein n=1 Tax=Fusarium odoratissimum (strain NRRL 54006) TaxID=1089451 RepID=X0J0R5_FUSO5|nr:uncharacterized protein FOIG_16758 [Fusarium odoratissimum NRRL 54006]EXL89961.1 hypothetical protein FOIG_16758 [Fusarium odoratissimum NRRL 54006]